VGGGGRRDENDRDWRRYVAGRSAKRRSVPSADAQFNRVALAFRSVWPLFAQFRLTKLVDIHEQRSALDSDRQIVGTYTRRRTVCPILPVTAVSAHSLLQTCPLLLSETFTSLRLHSPSRPVTYEFNGCLIVCTLFVLPINHRKRRHPKAIIF